MLLGGRKVVCSAGERWSARRERAVLLGGRGLCYSAREWTARCAARRVRGGLLGVLLGDGEGCTAGRNRGRLLGERGLCCWVGESWG